MKKKIVFALVDWLLKKFAPGWHRHKNPVRVSKTSEGYGKGMVECGS